MEDGAKAALAQQQQQLMQQQLLLQQIQRQKDAISRFPSNIDAHLQPQGLHPLLHHHARPPPSPQNPSSSPSPAPQQPQAVHVIPNSSSAATSINSISPQQQQQQKASLQLAYQDAWRVCHPDFKRPFSSLEDACERLLPYHVVADYEAEEDDKILDSDTTGQILSRSQQWDHNIAAKVAEFTATFEKQVLAFNIISRKRGLGEFRTEEKLMMEQFLLQDEKRALFELRAELESRQKAASRETQDVNMRMAAMAAQAEQARAEAQAHAEMMARAPIRGSALSSRGGSISIGPDTGEQEQDVPQDDIVNGWGSNAQKDDKELSEDFLNDDDAENGDTALQSEWHGGGELDLNAR